MRMPVKSERDAFRLAYGSTAVIAVAIVLGALVGALYGVVLLGGVVLGALAWELVTDDPERPRPLREAARSAPPRPADRRYRVLVVANETVVGRELREEIQLRAPRTPEVRVVCPILPSRAHYIASDIDRELAEARTRLDRTLAWAEEVGIQATGRVSEDTPLTAAADELRRFPAEELIVSTHPPARSRWLESGLVERLRDELDIPVHHVVVDLERAPAEPAPAP
jgi:hypothetical protein